MTPEPYRSPLGWNQPTIISHSADPEVQVSIPNEDPDTEDDLTINVKFTSEGIIVDLYVSDGEPVATFGQTYEEFVDTIYALDPIEPVETGYGADTDALIAAGLAARARREATDAPIQRVAALSADVRAFVDEDDALAHTIPEAANAIIDLLDAIDAMLSEAGR